MKANLPTCDWSLESILSSGVINVLRMLSVGMACLAKNIPVDRGVSEDRTDAPSNFVLTSLYNSWRNLHLSLQNIHAHQLLPRVSSVAYKTSRGLTALRMHNPTNYYKLERAQ